MQLIDIIVSVIAVVVVAFAIGYTVVRRRRIKKSGKQGCCGSCCGCIYASGCGSADKPEHPGT